MRALLVILIALVSACAVAPAKHFAIFADVPLAKIAAQFNEYNSNARIASQPLLRVSNGAGVVTYSGAWPLGEPESLARNLERDPQLHIAHQDGVIYIWTDEEDKAAQMKEARVEQF